MKKNPQLSTTNHDKFSRFFCGFGTPENPPRLQLGLKFRVPGPLDSRSMCDCPSQSPSPEKREAINRSQPASPKVGVGEVSSWNVCKKHWSHTKLKKEQRAPGTIQNQFGCKLVYISISCLIGGYFKPFQIKHLGNHHYSLYTYTVNVLCALVKLTCLGYCAMYVDPRVV